MSRAVLAIGAHPDDIEFLMSGTLMLLGAAGFEMHYLNIANGSLGTVQYDTPTIVAMRRDEAAAGGGQHRRDVLRKRVRRPGDFLRPGDTGPRGKRGAAGCAGHRAHSQPGRLHGGPHECLSAGGDRRLRAGHAQFRSHSALATGHEADGPLPRAALFEPRSAAEAGDARLLCGHHGPRRGQGHDARPAREPEAWLDESQGLDSYLQTLRDLDAEVGRMSGRFRLCRGMAPAFAPGIRRPSRTIPCARH